MDVDQYIEAAPAEAQQGLRHIRSLVRARCPGAVECMSYKMPAFRDGRVFIYYAAFKTHIGVYPPVTAPAALVKRLKPYAGPKGNLKFPYSADMPFELIAEVITALHQNYAIKT